MFLTRNRRLGSRPRVWLNPLPVGAVSDPPVADPQAQAELVSRTLLHLEQVQQLVCSLDEVPGGDRSGLLAELASAADGLRQLYFVDAIY